MVDRAGELRPIAIEFRSDRRIAAQAIERVAVIGRSAAGRHAHGAEGLRLVEESRLDVIDRAHAVDQPGLARVLESHVHHKALRRCDDDVVDPGLLFIASEIRGHDLHARAGALPRQVEDPGARHIGEEEPHHVTAARLECPTRFAVDQQHVAEAAHQRVCRCVASVFGRTRVADQQIVEHQNLFAVGRREEAGVTRAHEQVAVESKVLQHVLAMMRVIPVEARIREMNRVVEGAVRRHRILRDVRRAVEPVVETDAVPVDRGGEVRAIDEAYVNRRALIDLDRRAGILAVESEHRDGAAEQHPA